MKTIKLLFCITFLFFQGSYVCGQNWLWGAGSQGGLKLNDYASPVATDKYGDAYITGQYIATVIFGNDTLINPVYNAYLTKYNSAGTAIWARQIIDTSGSFGFSVATDEAENVYITGVFAGNAQVGTFSLVDSIYNTYSSDVFLAKYNANGTVLWAKQADIPSNSGYSQGAGYSVATDKYGNVFITGSFTDTISFGSFTLNTKYFQGGDVFIVKYDSNGNVLWAKQSEIPSAASGGIGTSVATDNYGNAYITGYFYDTISFGAYSLGGPYAQSSYLVKYSPAGNVLWAKQSIPNSIYSTCSANCITTDGIGNPYITGSFTDTIEFGSDILYSNSKNSVFLAKYDINGNAIWAKQSSPEWIGTGLASDGFKHIYMAGRYEYPYRPDTLKFANYILTRDTTTITASFLIEFDTSGGPLCGSIINSIGNSQTYNGVASYWAGAYVYMASIQQVSDTVFCGPDTLLPQGGINTFVARWLPCDNGGEGISKITVQDGNVTLYPNPNNGVFIMQSSVVSGRASLEIYNILGEKVLNETLKQVQGYNTINLSNQPNGIYLYRVLDGIGGLVGEGKLIIQR